MNSERNSLEMTDRSIGVTAEGAETAAVKPEQNLPSETTTLLDQTTQNGRHSENPRAAADGEGQPRRNSGVRGGSSLDGKDKTSRRGSKKANENEVFKPPLPPKPPFIKRLLSQHTADSKSLQSETGSNKEPGPPKGRARKNKSDIERFFKAIRQLGEELCSGTRPLRSQALLPPLILA